MLETVPTMPKKPSVSPPRERVLLNAGWRFHRGDAPDAGTTLDYETIRSFVLATGTELINAGVRDKPQRPAGEPGKRRLVRAARLRRRLLARAQSTRTTGASRDPSTRSSRAKRQSSPGTESAGTENTSSFPSEDRTRRVELDIDGAMSFSSVWLNGQFIGGWPYGYTSFRLDLTPALRFGKNNVLAVRLDNPELSSRWYPGAGLYRNVWLVKTGTVRIAHGSHFVTTPRVSAKQALVNVNAVIQTLGDEKLALEMTTRVYPLDENGVRAKKPVAVFESRRLRDRPDASARSRPRESGRGASTEALEPRASEIVTRPSRASRARAACSTSSRRTSAFGRWRSTRTTAFT